MGTHISQVQFKAICTFDQLIIVSRTENLKCKLTQTNFNQLNTYFLFNTKSTNGKAESELLKFSLQHGESCLYQQ